MTSQPDLQTVTIYILPNIIRSKDNETMKFVQLIEYNKRNIFFKNHTEIEVGRFFFPIIMMIIFYKLTIRH